jgi:hypothetical protein
MRLAAAAWFSELRRGGVAQLGERLLCKQEVIGSIPFTSTDRPPPRIGHRHYRRTEIG